MPLAKLVWNPNENLRVYKGLEPYVHSETLQWNLEFVTISELRPPHNKDHLISNNARIEISVYSSLKNKCPCQLRPVLNSSIGCLNSKVLLHMYIISFPEKYMYVNLPILNFSMLNITQGNTVVNVEHV